MKKTHLFRPVLILALAAALLGAGSVSAQDLKPVTLGQTMPNFALPVFQGGEASIAGLAGKNILLIFPRGLAGENHWCHVCNYQYADLTALEKETGFRKSHNLEVLFVLPYSRAMVQDWVDDFADQLNDIEAWKNPADADKLDEKGKARLLLMRTAFPRRLLYEKGHIPLPFPILIDDGAKVSKGLGLFTLDWGGSKIEQNVPTVLLIDAKGAVRFKYISQTTFDRPQAEYLLKFLETIMK
ncbi:MAG: redoxin domain-containing protein [Candidatus Aminicenantes bacterium]|nr:redoxin domain-containing protein [Candidatus Aminicenantes bacterium]